MKSANKDKSVLIFSNQGLSTLHLGYELEILETLVKEYKNVYALTCNNILSSCYFNPTHNLVACSICEVKTNKAHRQHYPSLKNLTLKRFNVKFSPPKTKTLDDLIELEFEGINIGRGIASSLVSTYREYNLSRIKNIDDVIKVHVTMAINTLLNFKEFIEIHELNEVYLFNGRFTEVHVITQLCKKLGINFYTYDTGSVRSKFMIKKNTTVHNIKSFIEELNYFKKHIPHEDIKKLGNDIYKERTKGNQGDVYNFLTLQSEGRLPENFDSTKNNIVIFNSSEDEMKVIEGWNVTLYKNQNDAIREIATHYKDSKSVRLYLRIHPNLINLKNSQSNELKELKIKNLTIIPPESSIDTYALIRATNKSVSFGSSAGIEASYLKKPSILLGNSFYKGLDCLYEPNSYEELYNLIEEENLPSKTSQNIQAFIYTLYNRGENVKNFSYYGKDNASYKGIAIKQYQPESFIQLFSYLNNYSQWKKMTRLIFNQKLSYKNMSKLNSHLRDTTHNK